MGDAHEDRPFANDYEEMAASMDLYNNYAGREAIESVAPREADRAGEFTRIILNLVSSGRLRYMKQRPDGTFKLRDTNEN